MKAPDIRRAEGIGIAAVQVVALLAYTACTPREMRSGTDPSTSPTTADTDIDTSGGTRTGPDADVGFATLTSPTSTATPRADANGYLPAPPNNRNDDRFLIEYAILEGGPNGPLLDRLQAMLERGDAAGLAAMVPVDGPGGLSFDGPLNVQHRWGENERMPKLLASHVAPLLSRLFQGGSRPVIQGYSSPFKYPQSPEQTDRLYVVSTGWHGRYWADADMPGLAGESWPDVATDAVAWSFRYADGAWLWDRWLWSEPEAGQYVTTVHNLGWEIAPEDPRPEYTVVRPRDLWPTPIIASTQDVPSPDGRWVAREIVGAGQLIDEHDPDSWRKYRALVVADSAGTTIHEPIVAWDHDGFPGHYSEVFAWRPDGRAVLFSSLAVPDGCGGPARELQSLDVGTGDVTPLDVAGWSLALDPAGARLACLTMRDEAIGQVNIRDLDTGEVVTGTIEAETVGYGLVWSPDGQAVAFTFGFDVDECARADRVGIARMEAATGAITALVQPEAMQWRIVAWRSDGTIELAGPTIHEKTPVQRLIDAATGVERR